jgi:hypothetical protein
MSKKKKNQKSMRSVLVNLEPISPTIYKWKNLKTGGNEPSRARARLGSARSRNELGSARSSDELGKAARLGSFQAREPARRANEPSHKFKSTL